MSLAIFAACCGPAAAQPRIPEPRIKICTVSDLGLARCITSDHLRKELNTLVDPAKQQRITDAFWSFAANLGADSAGDILAECHGLWRGVGVQHGVVGIIDLQAAGRPRRPNPGSLTVPERRALNASCSGRASPTARLTDPLAERNTADQRRVDNATGRMDEALGQCRDSSMGPVAQTSDLEKAYLRTMGYPRETGGHWDHEAHSTNEIAGKLIVYTVLIELAEQLREQQEAEAAAAAKAAAEEERKRAEEAARIEAAERAKAGQAPAAEEEAAQQCLQANTCTEPPSATPTASMPAPDGGGAPTCEQRRERWKMFKEHCERSNWREFRCEQFVRFMNGCVDATRIRPGPDGDLTCPGRTSDEEKRAMAAAAHCKKLGMIAIPSDPDKSVCRATTEVEFDLRFDPCNNPQAMPTPDQCPAVPAGGGTLGPTEPTPPGPDPRLPQ